MFHTVHLTAASTRIRCCRAFKSKLARRTEDATVEHEFKSPTSSTKQRIYGCGWPTTGALGIARFVVPQNGASDRSRVLVPARISHFFHFNYEVMKAAAGYGFSVFFARKGAQKLIMGCGINSDRQLGRVANSRGVVSAPQFYRHGNLSLVLHPSRMHIPVNPKEMRSPDYSVLHLSAGRAHSLFITTHGAFSFGNNSFGQCARPVGIADAETVRFQLPCDPTDVRQLVTGQDNNILVTNSGRVFTCGLGTDGQLGLGDSPDFCDAFTQVELLRDYEIIQVSCRGDTVLALGSKGEIFGWGNSEYNQIDPSVMQVTKPLRLKNVEDSLSARGEVPVQVVAAGCMCAVLTDRGHVWVWGYGKLGLGPDVSELSLPSCLPPGLFGRSPMSPDVSVVKLDAGLYHFAAITNSGVLYTWGSERSGALGLGHSNDQTFPLRVSLGSRVTWTACGVDHTLISGLAYA